MSETDSVASAGVHYLGQVLIRATLEVVTGLHIGAGKDEVEIGGVDNPVIKTPAGDPYVPGSSVKGKLRFILEWAFGKVRKDGKVWGWEEKTEKEEGKFQPGDPILRIFGTAAKREAWDEGPTRLLVRDAMLIDDWRKETLDAGRELTEVKTEVTIDRIAGKALYSVGPRQTERVPPGAKFGFEAVFRIYSVAGDEGEQDMRCLAWMIQGLDLLEQDALGGSGSRGYGQIRFNDVTLTSDGRQERLDNVLRGHAFSRDEPPAPILDAVHRVFGR